MAAELATEPIPGKDSRTMPAENAEDNVGIEALAGELKPALSRDGFDLVADGTVADYHRALGDRPDGAFMLDDFGASAISHPRRAVVVVGNSRAAWPCFMAALEREPARRREEHPFDRWTREVVSRAVHEVVAGRCAFDLRFAFEGGARAFSALHLAHACGLAHRGPASLVVHPRFGPWLALRAAIVFDLPGRAAVPAEAVCDACPAKPCLAALERALSVTDEVALAHRQVRERWGAWLEVRDACPVGAGERYPDAQIRWHYAHDRSALG